MLQHSFGGAVRIIQNYITQYKQECDKTPTHDLWTKFIIKTLKSPYYIGLPNYKSSYPCWWPTQVGNQHWLRGGLVYHFNSVNLQLVCCCCKSVLTLKWLSCQGLLNRMAPMQLTKKQKNQNKKQRTKSKKQKTKNKRNGARSYYYIDYYLRSMSQSIKLF